MFMCSIYYIDIPAIDRPQEKNCKYVTINQAKYFHGLHCIFYIYLHNNTEQFLVLETEHTLHANCKSLFTELHRELLGHVIRVEWISGGVLLVEKVNLQHYGGEVMLVRAELVRGHINLLVEGQGCPFSLR